MVVIDDSWPFFLTHESLILFRCPVEAGEGEISWLGFWLLLTGDVQ